MLPSSFLISRLKYRYLNITTSHTVSIFSDAQARQRWQYSRKRAVAARYRVLRLCKSRTGIVEGKEVVENVDYERGRGKVRRRRRNRGDRHRGRGERGGGGC